jgi:ribose transport system substrate-binding protein
MKGNKVTCYKYVFPIALILGFAMLGTACSGKGESKDDTVFEIAVMVKSLESDFWQIVLDGADKAAEDLKSEIHITHYGAKVELDFDEQIGVLENIINSQPDAIVVAAVNQDILVPQIEQAMDAGIPVILIDSNVSSDTYVSFLRTDNKQGGVIVAEDMVKQWETMGIDPRGKKVQVIQAAAGVPSISDREEGFRSKLQELVPDIRFLETQYTDNDINTTMSTMDNVITANSTDLVGVFATNNTTGIGIARSIAERGIKDKCVGMAFDAEKEEVDAVNEGALKGFVVQDPWGMGYLGVATALKYLKGENVDKDVDTGATLVTKDNINDPAIAALIDPSKRTSY